MVSLRGVAKSPFLLSSCPVDPRNKTRTVFERFLRVLVAFCNVMTQFCLRGGSGCGGKDLDKGRAGSAKGILKVG